MAKKSRPSVLKREREQKRRQREARKAAKAALKRERRDRKRDGIAEPGVPGEEDAQGNGNPANPTVGSSDLG